MRVGKGVRIPNDHHINQINVLFADGIVQSLPTGIPVKIWAKIFAGEMKNFEDLVHIPILTSKEWTIILAIIIWLFSVVLLFHRAVKSRRKPVISP
jgi:prepilin-type processing-associated H-X9-DG protein